MRDDNWDGEYVYGGTHEHPPHLATHQPDKAFQVIATNNL